ncbi:MAG: isochorismatase family protein [Balneola sp.]
MKKQFSTTIFIIALFFTSTSLFAQLPEPGFVVDDRTAILITDPQIDFLSPNGVTWGVVGKSVTDNNTVENIETLFKLGQQNNMHVFVSPHYYYPHDHTWKFGGVLEVLMHNINMFDREGQLSTENFNNSGADWLPRYEKYISQDNVVVSGPHKVFGPETNDVMLQMRKQGIDKVIIGGMSANLCVESHMRELLEQGFEVAIVSDATAAAIIPDAGLDGYASAMTNFRMMASKVFTTAELKAEMNK